MAAGGTMSLSGDRGPATKVDIEKSRIDEMTFFSKSTLFLQKSSKKATSNLRKKQLYNF